jgi:hypothetical protein
MKNRFFTASLGLVLLFALAFMACKNEPDAGTKFEGDWTFTNSTGAHTLQMRGANWTHLKGGAYQTGGSFTYTDTAITFTLSNGGGSDVSNYNLSGNTMTLTGGTFGTDTTGGSPMPVIWTRQ